MRDGTAGQRIPYLVLCLVYVAGVTLRVAWAGTARPWRVAPDHQAWGLFLREALEGPVRADQLFHFPHEGVSVLDGTVAFAIARLAGIDPAEALAWAALGIDSLGRALQTVIVARLFGPRVAVGFTLWSAAGSLLLIENATAAYGGHLALSLWPLIALAIVLVPPTTTAGAASAGALLGLGAVLGDQNLILVAVVVAMSAATGRRAVTLAVGTAAVFGALLFLRAQIDLGFDLVGFDWWNIRGVAVGGADPGEIARTVARALFVLLPASFALSAGAVGAGIAALVLVGGVAVVHDRRAAVFVALVTGMFVLAYALLFSREGPRWPFHAVGLRHFAWLGPALAAVAIAGWDRLGRGGWAIVLLPVVWTATAIGSARVMTDPGDPWYGTGFTVGVKIGDDPARIEVLARWVPVTHRATFWTGVGAGLGEAALGDVEPARAVLALIDSFPVALRPSVTEGVLRWFVEADPALESKLATAVWSGQLTRTGLVAPEPGAGLLLFGPSTLVFPDAAAPFSLVVLASGVPAGGGEPALELWAGPDLLSTTSVGRDVRAYDLGVLPAHTHVELRYMNDLVDAAGHDRNLVIHWIETNDAPPAPHP
jgi:hypothetical protein